MSKMPPPGALEAEKWTKQKWKQIAGYPVTVIWNISTISWYQGYPGNLIASVKYSLKEECHLDIEMCAATDRATVVNISNHVYFNLAGHGSGWEGMQQQSLQIHADTFTPGDEDYLPTGW